MTRRWTRSAGTALAAVVLLVAGFVLLAAVVVPRLAGATPYTVLTGSMEPGYPPGTVVVDRPADPDRIDLGSVITYQLVSGQEEVATHRVVAVARTSDGGIRFRTKGDANNAADPRWVRPEQVRGVVWYAVPWLGRLSLLLTPDQRRLGVQTVAVLLLGYAAVMVVGGRRRRSGTPA